MQAIVDIPGQQERQWVTVWCPNEGRQASVEALCLVTSGRAGRARAHRVLLEISSCSLGAPGRGCLPACDSAVRRIVEY